MKVLSKLRRFFDKTHPRRRYVYAVTAGVFLGELLVYIERESSNYAFLSLPTMTIRLIPSDKYELGFTNNILEPVEKLPQTVYNVCVKQYRKNKTSFNLAKA